MSARKRIRTGTVFAVPLNSGKYAIGLIVRGPKVHCALGYFFGEVFESVPTLDQVGDLAPARAVWIARFGDGGIFKGEWPALGILPGFKTADRPFPLLYQDNDVGGCFKSRFSEDDPCERIERVRVSKEEIAGLFPDSLYGYVALQKELSRVLGQDAPKEPVAAAENTAESAWGILPFDNDDAMDWLGDLAEEDAAATEVAAALRAVVDATGYLDAPDAECGLAAAEVVAAARAGMPEGIASSAGEYVKKWLRRHKKELLGIPGIDGLAIQAVDRILGDESELRDSWDETDHAEAWRTRVTSLRDRLGAGR
ncbi:MAG: DUF4259 domain-containing protein [Candidatus Sericytochromatia bacterium]|nr:DUF4259 domain-containing protein [Candidatus Tanganyikabacteria bacterium]